MRFRAATLLGSILLVSCVGDFGVGSAAQQPLVRLAPEPAGRNCAYGGTKVMAGLDANRDGVLEDGEIESTAYVCGGPTSPAPPRFGALVRLAQEPPGPNCALGGTKVMAGLDANRDGVLEDGEIESTAYVCAGSTSPAAAPSVPAGLSAQGSLGNIHLAWSASSGGGLTGYHVYRSTDGTSWTRINPSTVTAVAYDDTIVSPAGDGVVYQYEVTAVGDRESGPSQVARSTHGTRVPAYSASGFTTTWAGSPYVAEGTVVVDGGDLVVESGTKLYVVDDAVVDLERWAAGTSGTLRVRGLLRVLATPTAHATFTAHKVGGTLADNEGFTFWFDGAESYDAADGSGTLLQNALITKLAWGNSNGGFTITASSPRLYNLNASSNSSTGGSYISLFGGAGAIIQNCSFDRLTLLVEADLRGTTFKMDHVRFRRGYYSIWFANIDSPGIDPGQIELNDFDGAKAAYLFAVNAASPVPLGNNFWPGGAGRPPVPTVTTTDSTTPFEFATALTTAPSGTGPSWQP